MLQFVAGLVATAQVPVTPPKLDVPHDSNIIVSESKHTYAPTKLRCNSELSVLSNAKKVLSSELPEGEKTYFTVRLKEIYNNWGEIAVREIPDAAILVRNGSDKVWLSSPYFENTQNIQYLEGTENGGKMEFKLPLIIEEQEWGITEMSMMRFDKEQNTYVKVSDEENVLVLEVNANGEMTLQTSDQDAVIGETEDDKVFPELILGLCFYDESGEISWDYTGTWFSQYSPVELVSAPEGLVFEEWSLGQADPKMKYKLPGWNKIAGVAFDGNDIYIKGITEYCEDSLIKGTIENGVATFPILQAAGYCPDINVICFFCPAEAVLEDNTIFIGDDIPMQMTVDLENKTLTTENVMMYVVTNPEIRSYLNAWFEPMCIANTPEHLKASPETPTYQDGTDMTRSNLGYFMNYYVPNINVKGCVLDKAKMYYNI